MYICRKAETKGIVFGERMLSRANTQALKGFSAIGILVYHILLGYDISPAFNMWGGFLVTAFLVLSGYDIEESFRHGGLDGYWQRRAKKVVLPFVFFVFSYNYLFFFLFPDYSHVFESTMHKCLDELLYIKPTFWFVFFVLKCYAVYWIGSLYMGERLRIFFYIACALVCLNIQSPSAHHEAGQSFSFLAGVLLSMYKGKVTALTAKGISKYMYLLLIVGVLFFCLKNFTPLHGLKGSIAYNYMLCPMCLSCGLAFIPLFSKLRIDRSAIMRTAGKYSLEIYIAHIPFIGLILDARSTFTFLLYSVVSFSLLIVYRFYIEKKLGIAETLFIIINVLIVAKYSLRVSESFAVCATLSAIFFYYVLFRTIIPYMYKRICSSKSMLWNGLCVCCTMAIVGMLCMQYYIDPYAIQVDRWSALYFPIQNLLSGDYPYTASTHLGGNASPFPVWQVLHIPFYFMGNVGLSFFAAILLFLWSCYKVQGKQMAVVAAILLCTSVAVWYEAMVRSDLFTNVLLLATIVNMVSPHLNQEWIESRRWWIASVAGLLASTRLITLIPIGLLLFPYFIRMKYYKQVTVLLVMLIVFALTFVPFALWNWHEFYYFSNNPWNLQTRQGNVTDFILFIPMAIFLAMNHKGNANRYFQNTVIMLVIFVAVTFVHNMYSGENWDIFSSTYDITYFSTALPFCLLAIIKYQDLLPKYTNV